MLHLLHSLCAAEQTYACPKRKPAGAQNRRSAYSFSFKRNIVFSRRETCIAARRKKQLTVIRSLCIYAVLPHFEGWGARSGSCAAGTLRGRSPAGVPQRGTPCAPPSVYGAPPPAAKSRSLPAGKGRAAQKTTRNRRAKKQPPPRMGKLLFYRDMNRLTLLFLHLWRR